MTAVVTVFRNAPRRSRLSYVFLKSDLFDVGFTKNIFDKWGLKMNNDTEKSFLRVEGLKKYFPIKKGIFQRTVGHVQAVDGVSFAIRKGETLGLVGESGCGKSTTGRTIMHLLKPTEGKVYFKGKDVGETLKSSPEEIRKNIQIIFQDPFGSLNPRMTVSEIVGEAVKYYGIAKGKKEYDKRHSLREKEDKRDMDRMFKQ